MAERAFLIDTHCHLDLVEFADDLEEVLANATAAEVERFIIPGIDLGSIERIREIAGAHPAISFAAGIHPNNSAEWSDHWIDELRPILTMPKCVGLGEIGLDFYREYCPIDVQIHSFTAQLRLAQEMSLPVIIHCRQAFEQLWPILRAWKTACPANTGVLHAFDEDATTALEVTQAGFLLGIGGTYTYTKKNQRREEILTAVPLESIILETDAPYLTPIPHRGERNEPAYVRLTAQRVSSLKGVPLETVMRVTSANAESLFGKLFDSR